MSKIQVYSLIVIAITIMAATYSQISKTSKSTSNETTWSTMQSEESTTLTSESPDTLRSNKDSMSGANETYTTSKEEVEIPMSRIQHYMDKTTMSEPSPDQLTTQRFWIKVVFSGIFCLAALFVILSNKYDEKTKKWAFSVLTLIAGVWIGTI